jgi:hypothetical protein
MFIELFSIVDHTGKVTFAVALRQVFGLDLSLVCSYIFAGVRQQVRMAESNATNPSLHYNWIVDSIILPRIESQLPLHRAGNDAGLEMYENRRRQPLKSSGGTIDLLHCGVGALSWAAVCFSD